MVFIMVGSAKKETLNTTHVEVIPIFHIGSSINDAKVFGLDYMNSICPKEDGWYDHQTTKPQVIDGTVREALLRGLQK